ncbi:MAG: oligosaccharide flippase family protein [Nitrospiraceae bacterium]|nr:oligosaccharide flippase family protein [Nitrospiraceae bacterium]
MSLKKEYIVNTAWIGATQIINSIISYIIIVLISRELGASGLGDYSFLFSFVGLFFIMADLGLSALLIKELSKDFSDANHYLSVLIYLKIILVSLTFLLFLLVSYFLKSNSSIFIGLIIVGIIYTFNSFTGVYQSILRVKNQGKVLSLSRFSERIIALTVGGFFLIFFKSLLWFILSLLASNLIADIITFVYGKRYFKLNLKLIRNNQKYALSMIIRALPFLLISTFSFVFQRLDSIMLYFMKGSKIVGWYSSGYKLIDIITIVPTVLMYFGFPSFSRLVEKDKKNLKTFFDSISRFSMIIIIPTIFMVLLFSYRILQLIYHFNSIESAISFKILIIVEFFVIFSIIYGNLISSKDQKIFAYITGIGAGIDTILNFILIPYFSLYGAGIATLVSYATMLIFMIRYTNRNIVKTNILKWSYKPLIASLVMVASIYFIKQWSLFYLVPIATVVYFAALVLLGLEKSDKVLLRDITKGLIKRK